MLSSASQIGTASEEWKHETDRSSCQVLTFFLCPWMINLFRRILLKIKVEMKVFSGTTKFSWNCDFEISGLKNI